MARSRLRSVLFSRQMCVPDLHRTLREQGVAVNVKTLYQLAQESRALGRVDMRVVEAVCRALNVGVADLIDIGPVRLQHFPVEKQRRMDELLDLSNAGQLGPGQRTELEGLVLEAQALALENAQALGQRPTAKRRRKDRGSP